MRNKKIKVINIRRIVSSSIICAILLVFSNCNGKSNSSNYHDYYDLNDYVVKDNLWSKSGKNDIILINYINKYDKSWSFEKFYYTNGNIKSKGFSHNGKGSGLSSFYYPEKEGQVYIK